MRLTNKAKIVESSSLFLAQERQAAMEANEKEGTMEAYYGLSVRKATPAEKAGAQEDGGHFMDCMHSGTTHIHYDRQKTIKVAQGLNTMYNNGVGGVDK